MALDRLLSERVRITVYNAIDEEPDNLFLAMPFMQLMSSLVMILRVIRNKNNGVKFGPEASLALNSENLRRDLRQLIEKAGYANTGMEFIMLIRDHSEIVNQFTIIRDSLFDLRLSMDDR